MEPPGSTVAIAFRGQPATPGVCFTCGQAASLTWAHVPAKCVGNIGAMRPLVDIDPVTKEHTGELRYARGFAEGGVRVRRQCAACNNAVARFDAALKPLWHWGWELRSHILSRGFRPGHSWPTEMPGIDPGAVARSVIGGFTAMNEEIRELHPGLVDAVLTNTACELPPELFFGVGLHVGWACQAVGGYDYYSEPDVWGGRQLLRSQLASVCFPPFRFVLRRHTGGDPHFDIGTWLQEPAGRTRSICLIIPVLRDEDVVDGPQPAGADSF